MEHSVLGTKGCSMSIRPSHTSNIKDDRMQNRNDHNQKI